MPPIAMGRSRTYWPKIWGNKGSYKCTPLRRDGRQGVAARVTVSSDTTTGDGPRAASPMETRPLGKVHSCSRLTPSTLRRRLVPERVTSNARSVLVLPSVPPIAPTPASASVDDGHGHGLTPTTAVEPSLIAGRIAECALPEMTT